MRLHTSSTHGASNASSLQPTFLSASATTACLKNGGAASAWHHLYKEKSNLMNSLSDFAKQIRSPESMAIFNQMTPTITKAAGTIIDATKRNFSDSQYKAPNELLLNWVGDNRFQAEASYRDDKGTQHCISICDGVSKLLYMDSILIPKLCKQHLSEDVYAELFKLCDYGDGPRQVVPKDINESDFKFGFFTNAMMWVTLTS